jgi:uncharacterized 2Fe-2S/4Fe-4S cluster protein (DUF4445 family)
MNMTNSNQRKDTRDVEVHFLPFDVRVKVKSGTNLMDAVREAGLPLKASCGGKGTCGDCVVQILSGECQSKPSAALSGELADQDYVLACLAKVTGDLTVDLPHFEELYIKSVASFTLLEDEKENLSGTHEINPVVTGIRLLVPPPTLEDNYSDLARVLRELRKMMSGAEFRCEYSVMKSLAPALREQGGRISVTLLADGPTRTIIDARPASCAKGVYGIACDIGTTTVAMSLVHLKSGDVVETALGLNRQIKCGEDIISRINYAAMPGRLEELQNLVVATINSLLEKALEGHGISMRDVYYASLSGNTTMLHLLLGLEPRYIREEPYVPTFNNLPFVPARDLGLKINREARAYCAPAVGSYVGGDITAGLLVTPMLRDSDKVSMFIDAGTNGELVVGNRDWLMTCACSAGPAFEGGGVRCGMPATEGAIERIKISESGEPEYRIIEDTKPRGVCGSGLVDLLAELLVHGCIDRQGKFRRERVGKRLVEGENGTGFLIERAEKSYWGHDLVITERDIANLIRTKGAVFSACALLLKQVGLSFDKIDAFYIAGGFGQHLDVENAIRIGLLPDLARDRFHYLGNSSLLGAYLILISDHNRKMVEEVARKMTYIELNTEPTYMNEYTGALFLPHTNLDLFPSIKGLLTP